ncbi:MAG: hypothetical protein HUJ68_11405 [Clostridia bacterium]|nr:hypothetical protein [Clostridia bacterium]
MIVRELSEIIEEIIEEGYDDSPVFLKCIHPETRESVRITLQECFESNSSGVCYLHAFVKGRGTTVDDLDLFLSKRRDSQKVKGLISDSNLMVQGEIVDVYVDSDDNAIIEIECTNRDTLELLMDKIDF